MSETRDWNSNRDMWIRVLKQQTGKGLAYWNAQVTQEDFTSKQSLRAWLGDQGISGYAENLLVMERFGYPDFLLATADELVDGQFADRPHLRPIYDAVLQAVASYGEFAIQTRKSYVSLLTSRRTFARVRPSTKTRLDIGLRLDGQAPGGRLQPSSFQKTMKVQLSLTSLAELDGEAMAWLKKAYEENS